MNFRPTDRHRPTTPTDKKSGGARLRPTDRQFFAYPYAYSIFLALFFIYFVGLSVFVIYISNLRKILLVWVSVLVGLSVGTLKTGKKMKLTIDYEITEFGEADARNIDSPRQQVVTELATLHMILIEEIRRKGREVLKELAAAEQERADEERRWARFMYFCHTGRML